LHASSLGSTAALRLCILRRTLRSLLLPLLLVSQLPLQVANALDKCRHVCRSIVARVCTSRAVACWPSCRLRLLPQLSHRCQHCLLHRRRFLPCLQLRRRQPLQLDLQPSGCRLLVLQLLPLSGNLGAHVHTST
jgi:hypothetical protein